MSPCVLNHNFFFFFYEGNVYKETDGVLVICCNGGKCVFKI